MVRGEKEVAAIRSVLDCKSWGMAGSWHEFLLEMDHFDTVNFWIDHNTSVLSVC